MCGQGLGRIRFSRGHTGVEESAKCLCVPLMSSDLVRIPTTDMRGDVILLGSTVSGPELGEQSGRGGHLHQQGHRAFILLKTPPASGDGWQETASKWGHMRTR